MDPFSWVAYLMGGESDSLYLREISRLQGVPPFYHLASAFPVDLKVVGGGTFISTVAGFSAWNECFRRSFSAEFPLTNFPLMSRIEKNAIITALLADRITEFCADSLMDPTFPITINSIVFMLEMWIRVYGGPPTTALLRAFICQLMIKGDVSWTRIQMAKALADSTRLSWFPVQTGSRTLSYLLLNPRVGALFIPRTWQSDETQGKFSVFTYTKFFCKKNHHG